MIVFKSKANRTRFSVRRFDFVANDDFNWTLVGRVVVWLGESSTSIDERFDLRSIVEFVIIRMFFDLIVFYFYYERNLSSFFHIDKRKICSMKREEKKNEIFISSFLSHRSIVKSMFFHICLFS